MRENTPEEIAFQTEVLDAFIKYDDRLGFPVMADVMMAWLIHEMRQRMGGRLTYWRFLTIMTKTWNDLTKAKRQGLL
jgi:hypothetical protein